MNIQVGITRAAAYGLVGLLLVVSFIEINIIGLQGYALVIGNALLGLFWAFAAHRLREFIQTPLEEKWITDWYDSDKLVNRIATRLSPVMEKGEAFRIIAEELKSAIKIKNIETVPGWPDRELPAVGQTKEGFLVPFSSTGGPEGVLVLGPKVSEDPYDGKDRTVFATIMVQARAIFDRIRPYEQIKRELEATEQQLARSQRLAALGTTIAGVAHEIRNPLGIIHATAEELTDKPRTIEELRPLQEAMLRNSKRISTIITNMLGLAKSKVNKNYSPLDLREVVGAALQLIVIGRVKLVKDLQSVPPIKGDADELKQVLINLVNNALEAMPDEGTLTIRTGRSNGRVCLEVADTGRGIPEENLGKVFDPFFSTRHEGAGLGLSIVYRIVREHGAEIEVKSEPGRGAVFLIRFPAA